MTVQHPAPEPISVDFPPQEAPDAPHPGELLKALLREAGKFQRQLASEMGVYETYVSDVVRGKTGISVQFALGLERVLGTPALHWLYAQARYDLSQARRRQAGASTQTEPEDTEA